MRPPHTQWPRGGPGPIAALAAALALFPAAGVWAQTANQTGGGQTEAPAASSDNLDNLFNGGGGDTVAQQGGTALSALEKKEPLTFTGQLYSMAGGAVGWTDTPNPSNLESHFGELIGGSVTNYLYIDARPDPTFRFHGALEMAFPGFTPTMSELFFDYSMADVAFLRGGRQTIGWGNGRIFSVGDLMDNSATALSLKAFIPFGANGLTLVGLVPDPGTGADLTTWSPDFEGAPRLDLVIGSFEFSEEATFQSDEDPRWSTMVKTSLLGGEVFGQVFGTWDYGTGYRLSTLESVFWQTPDRKISLYGEHYFDGVDGYKQDHRMAFLAAFKVGGYTIATQWMHAFTDGSGSILPAVTFSPLEHLTITLGFPMSYGANGSIYAAQAPSDFNSPSFNPQNLTNPNLTSPITSWNQRYSIFLKVELSTSY